MKNDTWMPIYIGDYLADTSRLSTEQHGAYLLILLDYWRNGPPLDDDEELSNITKLPLAQWKKHAPRIRGYFTSVDGRLTQKRADEERQKAGLVSAKRSEAGKAGAEARWGKTDGKRMAKGMAKPLQTDSQNDAPSPSQSQETGKESIPRPPGAGAQAGVDGFEPTAAGALCKTLRAAGITSTNPGHPRLTALLATGATPAEFLGFATAALAKDDPFLWLLATVERERNRAARIPPAAGKHAGFAAKDYHAGIAADGTIL